MKNTNPVILAMYIIGVMMLAFPPVGLCILAVAGGWTAFNREKRRGDYAWRLHVAHQKLDAEKVSAGRALARF